jgi:hypothetical protein
MDETKNEAFYTIQRQYIRNTITHSDINEHLPTLYDLSLGCDVICECGVRSIVSTWAFLHALKKGGSLYCVDLFAAPNVKNVTEIASEKGVNMTFFVDNSASVKLPTPVDMLFIDTWHVYAHLIQELNFHHANVRKYIVMHDTEVDKVGGESIRCGYNIAEQARSSGYSVENIKRGLQPAIDEFLSNHPEWVVERVYKNCNGLTVLRRVSS